MIEVACCNSVQKQNLILKKLWPEEGKFCMKAQDFKNLVCCLVVLVLLGFFSSPPVKKR